MGVFVLLLVLAKCGSEPTAMYVPAAGRPRSAPAAAVRHIPTAGKQCKSQKTCPARGRGQEGICAIGGRTTDDGTAKRSSTSCKSTNKKDQENDRTAAHHRRGRFPGVAPCRRTPGARVPRACAR